MISVIVPAYNVEDTIERTLDSILAQSYSEIEVIVVDDGSTDHTGVVIDEYAEQHNGDILTVHTLNQGVTRARLTGVERSSGEWIGFVDADDEIEPDMYELLMSNARKYHADIAHCGYQMIFNDGRVSYFHNTGRLAEQDKLTGLKDLLDGSLVEPGLWNKLFHKTLFHSLLHTDVMDSNIKINEDLLMNYILFAEADKCVFEDVCKYHYMVRATSATRVAMNRNRIFDPIKVKQIILDLHITGMEDAAERAYLGTCVNVYNELMLEQKGKFKLEEKEVKALIKEHKAWVSRLHKKKKILTCLLLYLPFGYRSIYQFYSKHIQGNPYR